MTVIPLEKLEELCKGNISETENSKRKFSFEEFKNMFIKENMLDYLKRTNVKFIGEGSSRTAFFIPAGSYPEDTSRPVCLKVAKTKAGIAQNLEDIELYENYGDKYSCFPEMFEYDQSVNPKWMITEVGGKMGPSGKAFGKYLMKWDETIEDLLLKEKENLMDDDYSDKKFTKWADHGDRFIFNFTEQKDKGDLLNVVNEIANNSDMCEEIVIHIKDWHSEYSSKEHERIFSKLFDPIVRKYPKYKPLEDLYKLYAESDGNLETNYGDLGNVRNWAWMIRDSRKIPIPIDFGFSEKIYDEFYA